MRKINILLIILLTAQIGMVAYRLQPGRNSAEPIVELLPDISAENVTGINVEEPEKKTVNLVKNGKGDWRVAGAEGEELYPADQKKVEDVLARLTTLKSKRLVTRTNASHARLKVDDLIFTKKITLNTDKGDKRVLYLGSPVGGKTLHARSRGDDRAYLVTGISSWELATEPSSWWRRNYIELKEEKIKKVALKNQKGSFTLIKDSDWQLAEDGNGTDGLAKDKIAGFLEQIDNLKIKNYLSRTDDEYSLDDPEISLNLEWEDGVLTLKAAPYGEGKNTYVLKSSSSPFYVTMSSYVLKPLLEKEIADFRL